MMLQLLFLALTAQIPEDCRFSAAEIHLLNANPEAFHLLQSGWPENQKDQEDFLRKLEELNALDYFVKVPRSFLLLQNSGIPLFPDEPQRMNRIFERGIRYWREKAEAEGSGIGKFSAYGMARQFADSGERYFRALDKRDESRRYRRLTNQLRELQTESRPADFDEQFQRLIDRNQSPSQ